MQFMPVVDTCVVWEHGVIALCPRFKASVAFLVVLIWGVPRVVVKGRLTTSKFFSPPCDPFRIFEKVLKLPKLQGLRKTGAVHASGSQENVLEHGVMVVVVKVCWRRCALAMGW